MIVAVAIPVIDLTRNHTAAVQDKKRDTSCPKKNKKKRGLGSTSLLPFWLDKKRKEGKMKKIRWKQR